jgi:hypothetical protein
MNTIQRQNAMTLLEKLFDNLKIVPRGKAEDVSGLSEKSLAEAYYLETGDRLVKLNEYGIPAACSSFPHNSYIRVRDMNKKQVVMYSAWLKEHREGTVTSDDITLEQLDARKDQLLMDGGE